MRRHCHALLAIVSAIAAVASAQEPLAPLVGPQIGWPSDLGWQNLERRDRRVDTRFGALEVSYGGDPAEGGGASVEIRFEGEPVVPPLAREGDFGSVDVRAAFGLAAEDLVLLSATAGGSGSPPPLLLLVSVASDREPALIRHPALRSRDWTQRVAADAAAVYFDLGYEQGRRKLARYSGGSVEVLFADVPPESLPVSTCRQLYDSVTGDVCRLRQPLSRAILRLLEGLEHRPGFDSERVIRVCGQLGDVGEAPAYDAFENTVCRLQN